MELKFYYDRSSGWDGHVKGVSIGAGARITPTFTDLAVDVNIFNEVLMILSCHNAATTSYPCNSKLLQLKQTVTLWHFDPNSWFKLWCRDIGKLIPIANLGTSYEINRTFSYLKYGRCCIAQQQISSLFCISATCADQDVLSYCTPTNPLLQNSFIRKVTRSSDLVSCVNQSTSAPTGSRTRNK